MLSTPPSFLEGVFCLQYQCHQTQLAFDGIAIPSIFGLSAQRRAYDVITCQWFLQPLAVKVHWKTELFIYGSIIRLTPLLITASRQHVWVSRWVWTQLHVRHSRTNRARLAGMQQRLPRPCRAYTLHKQRSR